ncbi:hypothetical protein THAOC_29296, partial [Thalassiosira oceanica]
RDCEYPQHLACGDIRARPSPWVQQCYGALVAVCDAREALGKVALDKRLLADGDVAHRNTVLWGAVNEDGLSAGIPEKAVGDVAAEGVPTDEGKVGSEGYVGLKDDVRTSERVVVIDDCLHPAAARREVFPKVLERGIARDRKVPAALDSSLMYPLDHFERGREETRPTAHTDVGLRLKKGVAKREGVTEVPRTPNSIEDGYLCGRDTDP